MFRMGVPMDEFPLKADARTTWESKVKMTFFVEIEHYLSQFLIAFTYTFMNFTFFNLNVKF